jgi:hypothetical protein
MGIWPPTRPDCAPNDATPRSRLAGRVLATSAGPVQPADEIMWTPRRPQMQRLTRPPKGSRSLSVKAPFCDGYHIVKVKPANMFVFVEIRAHGRVP